MVSGGTANFLAQERLDRQSMVHVPTEEILTQIDEDEVRAGSDRINTCACFTVPGRS